MCFFNGLDIYWRKNDSANGGKINGIRNAKEKKYEEDSIFSSSTLNLFPGSINIAVLLLVFLTQKTESESALVFLVLTVPISRFFLKKNHYKFYMQTNLYGNIWCIVMHIIHVCPIIIAICLSFQVGSFSPRDKN